MDKAYDLKALGEMIIQEARKEGFTIAEDALEKVGKSVYLAVKQWAIESSNLSENKIDDFLASFYSQVDKFVLPQIDKIDLDGDGK